MKVDLIKRAYSDNTKEYSIIWGIDKELNFYVYTIPDFLMIYKGSSKKESENKFNEYLENFCGEIESFI